MAAGFSPAKKENRSCFFVIATIELKGRERKRRENRDVRNLESREVKIKIG